MHLLSDLIRGASTGRSLVAPTAKEACQQALLTAETLRALRVEPRWKLAPIDSTKKTLWLSPTVSSSRNIHSTVSQNTSHSITSTCDCRDAGVRLVWRIADILNYNLPSPKCFIETLNASTGDQGLGGAPTTVTSYVWVYTW